MALLCLGFALAGCAGTDRTEAQRAAAQAQAQAQARARAGVVDPYRQILVIGPNPRFDSARLPETWYVATRGSEAPKFVTAEKDGVLALRLDGDPDGAIIGRKFHLPLLNMPYLRWGWYVDRPVPAAKRANVEAGVGEPSVLLRVVVGFRDSAGNDPDEGAADTHEAPKIDRAISLEWRADEAVGHAAEGSVVMRAGRGDSGKWIIEAVDLSRIYSKAWPQNQIANARIVFVAVGAGPTRTPATGYVAEVVLLP
ncbi:MAG TPA: hypothetical protein VI732_05290 [Alphaproteobacteria bacterium]|nr:hypothetical protein [Alphaproteobacteria bacterium]